MQRLSIQKGHAFMLLYSITSKQTIEELKPIYNQIREIKADQQCDTPILLMGCKLDETACREVTENLGKQLASHWSCAWIETSAKTNTNIR
jgi:GTPase SAR1 family protein